MEIIKVESNVLGSNTYVLKNNKKVILIDAGASVEQLEPYLDGWKVEGVL